MTSCSRIVILEVSVLALFFPLIIIPSTLITYPLNFKTNQPTGPHPPSVLPCMSYNHNGHEVVIPCPHHTTADNDWMEERMEECREIEGQGNTYGVTCVFFPTQINPKSHKQESCHTLEYPKVPCLFGFRIRPSRLSRRGNADDAFITIEFFGKIPPFPQNQTNNHTGYDVAEYIALGISPNDKVMGDDLVIYCHPFMDRNEFPFNMSEEDPLYPESIGVATNKYYTTSGGKQAYDAERKFNGRVGRVKLESVTYWEGADITKPSWGALDCKADISTYILLKSRQELFTGIELDMEKTQKAYVFLAVGHCLQQECLGDHKNNSQELADIARRTTPMSYHKQKFIWGEKVVLFQQIDIAGRGERLGISEGMILVWVLILNMLLL